MNLFISKYLLFSLFGLTKKRKFFTYIYIYIYIPGRVIPKTQKMVLDAALLNTQHYKVIKGEVEQSRVRSCALPYTLV